jgi:hypothetical protein
MQLTIAYAKLLLTPAWKSYTCTEASNTKMEILGNLLSRDVGCNTNSYKQTLADNTLHAQCGNFIFMAKENNYIIIYIIISDLYSEETTPTEFKMPQQVFIQLLDEWQEKVCKNKLKEVIIKHNNDQFFIETYN